MKVHQIEVGNMQNFTYVVEDEETRQAIVIDPSWDLEKINDIIQRNNLSVKYIVNTHYHFDHTIGNEAMVKQTGAKIIQYETSEIKHDIKVSDGDKIKFGSSELLVLYTPGHSQDSMCLVGDGKIFSGDTLFVGTCGRVDLLAEACASCITVWSTHFESLTIISSCILATTTVMCLHQLLESKKR